MDEPTAKELREFCMYRRRQGDEPGWCMETERPSGIRLCPLDTQEGECFLKEERDG
ncbi:hypothetical protein LCGC14_1145850 [marine sediment metagenome]|uniref:Uncharacterized protein n=1 Tax=marine sediment metagenome TaxID=412755 RepID=A0A0F9MK23_9ZZZZ